MIRALSRGVGVAVDKKQFEMDISRFLDGAEVLRRKGMITIVEICIT